MIPVILRWSAALWGLFFLLISAARWIGDHGNAITITYNDRPQQLTLYDLSVRQHWHLDLSAYGVPINFGWSNDGHILALALTRDYSQFNLYLYDVRSRQMRRIDHPLHQSLLPTWTADSQTLIFSGEGPQLCTLILATDQVTCHQPGLVPTFSPNGKHLAYLASAGNGWQLWVSDADLGNPRLILQHDELITHLHWAVDGSAIAYLLWQSNIPKLYQVIWMTSAITHIGGEEQQDIYHLDRRGDRFIYTKDQNGNSDLYLFDLTTNQEQQLTFDGQSPRGNVFAPYGDYLAYVSLDLGRRMQQLTVRPLSVDQAVYQADVISPVILWRP
jgi:Tol biopolymer transport system component